ncbi:MAG TPA: hypothetical protein PKW59_09120 [Thermotogota bacterium]|nr:hypothetical protein [Thermotogota bacterium]
MANGFQRAIYNFANAVPLAIMTALAWYLEFKTWNIPIILLGVAVAVTVLFAVCFYFGKNNCPVKSINVSKIISKDSWLVAYVIAYVLPFAYMVMSDYHIVSVMVVGIMLVLVIIPAIMALPNILLFFVGYHFYEIETESTGVGDYILISKRQRIRNKADVKTVIRVFEKLLIDTKGGK